MASPDACDRPLPGRQEPVASHRSIDLLCTMRRLAQAAVSAQVSFVVNRGGSDLSAAGFLYSQVRIPCAGCERRVVSEYRPVDVQAVFFNADVLGAELWDGSGHSSDSHDEKTGFLGVLGAALYHILPT